MLDMVVEKKGMGMGWGSTDRLVIRPTAKRGSCQAGLWPSQRLQNLATGRLILDLFLLAMAGMPSFLMPPTCQADTYALCYTSRHLHPLMPPACPADTYALCYTSRHLRPLNAAGLPGGYLRSMLHKPTWLADPKKAS